MSGHSLFTTYLFTKKDTVPEARPPHTRINYAGICFQGNVRKNNEDNYYILGDYLPAVHTDSPLMKGTTTDGLFAVFDGMGGEEDGEMASFIAASHIETHDLLEINQLICDYTEEKNLRFCGSTAAVVHIENDMITASNAGDSRIYRMDRFLQKISTDHTRLLQGRTYLSQSLGVKDFVIEPYVTRYPAVPGEKYLICSDGITDMINNDELEDMLQDSPGDAIENIKNKVLKRGAIDNSTAIVLEIVNA